MIKSNLKENNTEKGYAILFTVVLISVISLITFGLSNTIYKQVIINSVSKDSQSAFYQADVGTECALYADNMLGLSIPDPWYCGGMTFTNVVGNASSYDFVSTASTSIPPSTLSCFNFTITKNALSTDVQSRGYSRCDGNSLRKVEREIDTSYSISSSTPTPPTAPAGGPYNLTILTTGGTGSGSYSSTSPSGSVDDGTTVSITATPDSSSNFTGWLADGSALSSCNTSSNSLCTFTMTGDASITAVFTLKVVIPVSYTYTFAGNGATTPATPASVTQNSGTSISTPTPPLKTGYTFSSWSPAIPAIMPVGGGTSTAQWTVKPIAVGDLYKGGKVAYVLVNGDPGYDAGTQHGIIASLVDLSTGIYWHATNGGTTGATGTAIGTGLSNTNAVVALYGSESNAAKLAYDYVNTDTGTGIYSDWYLPSKDELNKLYLNKTIIGGFSSGTYWSSSEYSWPVVWGQIFSSGSQNYMYSKTNNTFSVRAIRTF